MKSGPRSRGWPAAEPSVIRKPRSTSRRSGVTSELTASDPPAPRATVRREAAVLGELDAAAIESLLLTEVTGRIGCHAQGRTYVVPITYAYESGSVYGHSTEGLKLRMMRENPRVCFQVDRVRGPADWESVIAWGDFEELKGARAIEGFNLLMRRGR